MALQPKWTKDPAGIVSCKLGPLAIRIEPKGDGRFAWQIINGEARNPMASGVAASLGAAKTVTVQFAERSALV